MILSKKKKKIFGDPPPHLCSWSCTTSCTSCCWGFLSILRGKIKCYRLGPKTKNNCHIEKNIVSEFQKIISAHSACARKWALKVHKNRCFCSFWGWRFAATLSEQKTKMSGTSRRIKYQKIKKIVRANFEKNTKEHKKQVFLHLYRCKKRKIQKSGSVRFFPLPQGIY